MRMVGLTGAAAQLTLAFMLGGVASGSGSFPSPPEPIPRGIALFVLFALPAAIGAIGAISTDRALLAAAAILSAAGSVIAFSGITLLFLAPALAFAVAAGGGNRGEPRPRRPILLTVSVLIVGGAAVVMAVLDLGLFAFPLIILVVLGIGLARGRHRRVTLGGGIAAMLIVVAGIGAGWSLFALTETLCWEAHQTPSGIEYRSVPETSMHVFPAGTDIVASGCDGGAFTPRGAGIAAVLSLGAMVVAAVRASSP
jgi:hypothetical protein